MYRVLTCLTTQHDYRLVALAGVVCAVGSFISFLIYTQVREPRNAGSDVWLGVTGFSAGGTIWATHYIGMLAYDSRVPTTYSAGLTTLSLVIAFIIPTIGFAVSARYASRLAVIAGGIIVGLGIAAMHFIGMNGLMVAGAMEWDLTLAATATLLGSFVTAAAMLAFFSGPGVKGIVLAASLLTLGICLLHFTAMGAVTITPDPTISIPVSRFDDLTVAVAIASVALIVLAAGIVVVVEQNRAAREAGEKTRELVDAAQEALVLAKDGRIVDANLRATELCGIPHKRLIGTKVFGGLLDAAEPAKEAGGVYTLETDLKSEHGAVPVEVVRQPLKASGFANECYAIRDLRELIKTTDRLKRMNEELQNQEQELRVQNFRFQAAVTNMSQGLCMFDAQQRVVISNDRYAQLYGLSAEEIKPGTTLTEIIDRRIAKGVYAGSSAQKYRRERLAPLVRDLDMIQELSDGRFISITLRLMPGGGWVTTHEDVTEQRRAEARISHLAHHDALTDLPNRVLLLKKLEKHLQGSRQCDTCLAVLMLDLDRFKEVNDTLGHLAGDILLKMVAERLRKGLRDSATVARFGGDEFSIIETIGPTDDVEALPRRVTELISLPMEIEGQTVSVGTSIGIAVSPVHGTNPDELLKRADLALYRAKGDAKGTYRFFEPGMDAAVRDRRLLENDMRQALSRGEFELHYQPLLNLARGEITAYEALLRWKHPTRGMIPPSVFIPFAEETGIIGPLGEWVLQQACAEAASWPPNLNVAVNLSVQQFKSRNLTRAVIGALANAQLAPQRLELEITETFMLKEAEDVFATLRQFQELGVRIALDDFGTGFSALNYLLHFSFDKIKIDRSFVGNLADNPHSLVLLRSLIQIGRGLGVDVTAEGVETREQLEIVRAEGCTEIQGFYLSKPKPASALKFPRLRLASAQVENAAPARKAGVSAAEYGFQDVRVGQASERR